MPGISPIAILGNVLFLAKGLKLPSDKGPGSDKHDQGHTDPEDHYSTGVQESNNIPPEAPTGIPWFLAQIMNKLHSKSCNEIGKNFKDFHDASLDAVKYSVDMWKLQAKFKDLKVMAVSAIGTPGCLDGPELKSNIENAPSYAPFTDDNGKAYKKAVAAGVSDCFKKWQDKVMVPGLPWYPAFAAFPGPQAPPMPNVPVPLVACISPMMTEICMPSKLKDAMIGELDSGVKDQDKDKQHEALFDSIGTCLALAFIIWLVSQQVMLVLGKGPIPTFAPPYVPVGPVVMGDNIAAPGHLMA